MTSNYKTPEVQPLGRLRSASTENINTLGPGHDCIMIGVIFLLIGLATFLPVVFPVETVDMVPAPAHDILISLWFLLAWSWLSGILLIFLGATLVPVGVALHVSQSRRSRTLQ